MILNLTNVTRAYTPGDPVSRGNVGQIQDHLFKSCWCYSISNYIVP